MIDQDRCIKCGRCFEVCRFDAVLRNRLSGASTNRSARRVRDVRAAASPNQNGKSVHGDKDQLTLTIDDKPISVAEGHDDHGGGRSSWGSASRGSATIPT